MAGTEFTGLKFHCTEAQKLPDGSCPIKNGEQELHLLDMDQYSNR
jgi:hypothetical protein